MNKEFERAAVTPETISERDLYEACKNGFKFDFATGLPCGELRHFIAECSSDPEVGYVQATNERESVGIAAGAWLANKKPVLNMQNSGLFECSNDLGSLLIPCKIPALFVVSWRGAPGESATQHLYTGAATIPLINAFGLPYVSDTTPGKVNCLRDSMQSQGMPGVILVKREKFNDTLSHFPAVNLCTSYSDRNVLLEPGETTLSREMALNHLMRYELSAKDAIISSTGLISRSLYHNFDSSNQFYNAGAFGLTSSIGLGFAINKPETRTIVIEGDGSVLTNLGALNLIGHSAVKNLLHIVLDNQAYLSCSGEKTYGSEVISRAALDFGYKQAIMVHSIDGINKAIETSFRADGPTMIQVRINQEGDRNFRRPLEMADVAKRFKDYFNVKD